MRCESVPGFQPSRFRLRAANVRTIGSWSRNKPTRWFTATGSSRWPSDSAAAARASESVSRSIGINGSTARRS